MTRDEEQELVNMAILFAKTVREELPAIRAALAQIRDALESANMRNAI